MKNKEHSSIIAEKDDMLINNNLTISRLNTEKDTITK